MESKSIAHLQTLIGPSFVKAVHTILDSKGRVVVTGIGKSAIIGQKIVATLNSTGTPSLFMHAADAIHGDLGMIQRNDVVICISKSGSSPEINVLTPLLKTGNNPLIAITGNMHSELALNSDICIDTTVEKEACPNNLAPTTSTSAQLAMGDALAVALLSCREFTSEDFAKYHPGGSLGKKVYLRVGEMARNNNVPVVKPTDSVKECILHMTEGRMGAVVVVENERVIGIITDGDLRRMLSRNTSWTEAKAEEIMSKDPHRVEHTVLAAEAVNLIKEHKINHIIAVEGNSLVGIVHIQDFIREGLL